MRTTTIPALVTLLLSAGAVAKAEPPPYDWGVAYYMSYDNNLEVHGASIIARIRDGIVNDRTVAAVQADFRDPGGMRRISLHAGEIEETRLDSDDSASEARFVEYLSWFVRRFRCKRYVVIILNHGGKLDEMCRDDSAGVGPRRWMSGRLLGETLRQMDGWPGTWELLFLQQCGRGSLEDLYSFRGTARFVMSSPVNVGAPNTYYTAFHRWLGATPSATGAEVAARIAALDDDYSIYSCIRTAKLDELPGRLDQALRPFLSAPHLSAPGGVPVIYNAAATVDATTFLTKLAEENRIGRVAVACFLDWVERELLTHVWSRDPANAATLRRHGLSLYPPPAGAEDRSLRVDLSRDSRLPELWKRLRPPATSPAIRYR